MTSCKPSSDRKCKWVKTNYVNWVQSAWKENQDEKFAAADKSTFCDHQKGSFTLKNFPWIGFQSDWNLYPFPICMLTKKNIYWWDILPFGPSKWSSAYEPSF